MVADIPGLIEGAHSGAGLGLRFLRHVERCRLLLHLVDATDVARDPVTGIDALNDELRRYRPELALIPQIVVLTKADALQETERADAVRKRAAGLDQSCHLISSVTGEGLEALIREIGLRLDELSS